MRNKSNTLSVLKIGLLGFILFYSSAAFSATVNVSTIAKIVNTIASAFTPTEIVLASGNYGGGDTLCHRF